MKKVMFAAILVLIGIGASAQQKFRLNGYAMYVFDDKFDSYYDPYNYYNGKIKGGFQWGVGAEFMINPTYGVELLYLNQSTTAPTTYQGGQTVGVKNTDFDMNLSYVMLGFGRHLQKPDSKAEAYGGLMLGVGIINIDNPESGSSGSATKFAWGARLGCNVWASQRVGIKLQTQLTSISQGAGGGLYFGTGGAGVGLSSYSSIYQFGLGGGLTLRIGQ